MKSKKGRNKHGLKCDCLSCRAEDDPLAAYLLRHREFFRRVLTEGNETPEDESTLRQAAGLLSSTADIMLLMGGAWAVKNTRLTLPGYFLMGHVDQDGDIVDEPEMRLLDLWDVDTTDAGEKHLRMLLDQANEARSSRAAPPYNAALWITGVFGPDIPLHGVALDDRFATGFLLARTNVRGLPLAFMPEALQLLREEATPLLADPHNAPAAQGQRLLSVIQAAGRMTGHLGAKLTSLLARYASAISDFEAELTAQRTRITSQADERRRAAMAAKNRDLTALRTKVSDLTKQLGVAQRRVRELEKMPGAAPAGVQQVDQSARAEVAVLDQVEVATAVEEPEDSDSHWRETAEHQAGVLREMRLVMKHFQAAGREEGDPQEEPAAPRKLSDLADWAAENADRVIVLKRALQAARKSIYEDEEFVFKALDMLATTYRDVKLGLVDRMAYQRACESLGLEMGGSIDIGVSDAYFFGWKGRKAFLDQHIGRGIARDPRYCFRAYFTWDAEEAKVIIGWLPSHLPTRAT